jgi:hypothetical protein
MVKLEKVEEFYFDDQTSTIRYMVVKTGGWLSEKKVLIFPEAFQNWIRIKTLSVNLTGKNKKQSDIETDKPVSEQQEELIRGYYSWPLATETGMYGHMGLGMWGYPLVEVKETEKK